MLAATEAKTTKTMPPPKERPISFSPPMILSLVAGRKTQTRRIITDKQPTHPHGLQRMYGRSPDGHYFGKRGQWCEVGPDYPDDASDLVTCPYGAEHDQLWVKETWGVAIGQGGWTTDATINYRADGAQVPMLATRFNLLDTVGAMKSKKGGWRGPRFMPRWASRFLLDIRNVRAQRVQDMTEADAIAEGVEGPGPGVVLFGLPENDSSAGKKGYSFMGVGTFRTARLAYAFGFDAINGSGSWQRNPWCWALTFKPVER